MSIADAAGAPSAPSAPRIAAVLGMGIVAVSFASILIRWAAAPALSTAFYRLLFASVFFWMTHGQATLKEWRGAAPALLGWSGLSGMALAVHFAAWITSLSLTSVSSSVVLISTTPLWVALGTTFFLRESVRLQFVIGLMVALGGAILISATDAATGQDSLWGDVLAVVGAMAGAVYLMIGRRVQRELNTWAYVTAAYSAAAIALLVWAILAGAPLRGFDGRTYGLFALIALVPQVVGHTSFNWALRYLSAPLVSVMLLGEPLGATMLAYFLLDEELSLAKIVGGGLTLAGVMLAAASERAARKNAGHEKK